MTGTPHKLVSSYMYLLFAIFAYIYCTMMIFMAKSVLIYNFYALHHWSVAWGLWFIINIFHTEVSQQVHKTVSLYNSACQLRLRLYVRGFVCLI